MQFPPITNQSIVKILTYEISRIKNEQFVSNYKTANREQFSIFYDYMKQLHDNYIPHAVLLFRTTKIFHLLNEKFIGKILARENASVFPNSICFNLTRTELRKPKDIRVSTIFQLIQFLLFEYSYRMK